ncbi:MAG: hypothetical protein C0449_20920 [Polaromonas sp.]|nr:hypothetical protein [Polaromonas sp.]
MSIFDFLKPKWSAGQMTEDDRARRFWVLKAITSYTAWKRCRDRYAVFVDLVERQCKEEPVGRLGPVAFAEYKAMVERWVRDGEFPPSALNNLEDDHRTDWDHSTYADALRGLSLYDQGLALLKQGDRGVFLHNSRGLLEDAYHHAEHAYIVHYVGDTNQGSWTFYGKYVPAMKAALLWAYENGGFSAGGLQAKMANLSAPSIWQMPHDYVDVYGKKQRHLGTSAVLKQETAHLKTLPTVPTPTEDVLVQTGQPCPVFGIYEPLVKDGLMTYMCAGQEAYRYGERCGAPGGGTTVTWKLIWEDTRYVDGVIPEEEADYYPESNTPPDFSALVGAELIDPKVPLDQIASARSGQPAQYTGTWAAMDDLGGRIFWKKGEKLPLHNGREVEWVYNGI